VSGVAHTPAVVGWLRPVVLVPAAALAGLPPEQLEALLIHELAHIRRHDYLVNVLQGVVEALLFYHPAVWWVSGHIRTEREFCCADIVVGVNGDVLTYARALAEMESFRPAHPGVAMAANSGSLIRRIGRLLAPEERPEARTFSGAGVAMSAILVATMILLPAFSGHAQSPASAQAVQSLKLGNAAFDAGKFEVAGVYFQQALQLDPASTEAELGLARANGRQYIPGAQANPKNEAFAEHAISGFERVLAKD